MADSTPLLVPGQTCWRTAPADRLALIVDADGYFRAAKAAMLAAQHRIMLIGWDFDTRIELEPRERELPGPNRLGRFLVWLTKSRPDVHIYLLKWDLGTLTDGLARGMPPVFLLNLFTSKRMHLVEDGAHPPGAAHHQKIVVIDDALAFCGGIDMTVDRWDTRDHPDDDVRRTNPNGAQHGPWHDATVAVDGAAAALIGEVARERWLTMTGENLEPIDAGIAAARLWPRALQPTMEKVDVAIARTLPELNERTEVREIEELYVRAIRAARNVLYFENQYLAARGLVDEIAARLRAQDGPEVVIVLPRHSEGWLERQAMDGARYRLLAELWEADEHDRLRVYFPVTAGGQPIYVHAKLLVVDDRLVRVGSANLNNRSMGFDTECDIAVEANASDAELAGRILDIRDDLIAEHLGVGIDRLRAELTDSNGSLVAAIDALRLEAGEGRTLVPFDSGVVAGEDSPLAESELLDPARRPFSLLGRLRRVIDLRGRSLSA
ncbi:phospholipase [Skermania sp. ID1734]|nr:phospholipase [Skermania sp. ID1734]